MADLDVATEGITNVASIAPIQAVSTQSVAENIEKNVLLDNCNVGNAGLLFKCLIARLKPSPPLFPSIQDRLVP